jgi:putative membrane protein
VTPAVESQARARDGPVTDPRIYFAAERTLLAWIRTGLAMMGFGFVVARFALYLRELTMSAGRSPARSPEASLWFGTALVVMGVLVNLSAAVQHVRLVQQLGDGTWTPDRVSRAGTVVAIALALVGLVVAAHLLLMRPA